MGNNLIHSQDDLCHYERIYGRNWKQVPTMIFIDGVVSGPNQSGLVSSGVSMKVVAGTGGVCMVGHVPGTRADFMTVQVTSWGS